MQSFYPMYTYKPSNPKTNNDMDNEQFCDLNDMDEDYELYGTVEIEQLRSVWRPRKFSILAHDSIVRSGLLPSIFDWQLLWQLMPAKQSHAEMVLQQRINDLELMNSLTTSLQHIQTVPEAGIAVDVIRGRPKYQVHVQDDGSVVVKERPRLYIHVFGVETRAAAGQECLMEDPNLTMEQTKELLTELDDENHSLLTEHEKTLFNSDSMHDESSPSQPSQSDDLATGSDQSQKRITMQSEHDSNSKFSDVEIDENEAEAAANDPNAYQIEERNDRNAMPGRQSFWLRFSNWFCQNLLRINP